jgi:uncharacterized cupredoxin-like copper-binding protein
MTMKRKLIIAVALVSFVLTATCVYATSKFGGYDESKIVPSWGITPETQKIKEDNSGMIMPQEVENPEPVYKDNKDIPVGNLFDINKKIDKEKLKAENAELEMVKSMTYEEFCKMEGKDTKETTMLAPGRTLWIVKTKKPNGVKIPLSPDQKKKGISDTIKNAIVTDIYDAETGDFIGTEVNVK